MTAGGSSAICNVIQAFPALLILVQNTQKCLHTPFHYKPPSPTQAPEYYEAYDTLIHALFHDYRGCQHGYDKRYFIKKPCHHSSGYPNYGPDQDIYGHGYGSPYYGYQYPYSDKYPGTAYPSTSKYPNYAHANVFKLPGYYEIMYPIREGEYHGYSHNGYKVANGYNTSTSYLYKTNYAPSQVYNTKQKHKIVVVRSRRPKLGRELGK